MKIYFARHGQTDWNITVCRLNMRSNTVSSHRRTSSVSKKDALSLDNGQLFVPDDLEIMEL